MNIDSLLIRFPSLSEWGCIKNRPRKFEELAALMSDEMTSVYSGGIMYEYSKEDNDYGIVTIDGDSVSKSKEYSLFKSALAKNPTPTGSGGAASSSHAAKCPPKDPNWNVDPSLVPEMPSAANKYMKKGAGDGPGLGGDGSQNAADSGTATASVTGGTASPTGTSGSQETESDSAAGSIAHGPLDTTPFVVSGLALLFTMFGTLLL